MVIELIKKENIGKEHYIDYIEDIAFKVYPTHKQFRISIEYNVDEHISFEFKQLDDKEITADEIFELIEPYICFGNEYKNIVAYNPYLIKQDHLEDIASTINFKMNTDESIKPVSFKFFKLYSITKDSDILKLNYNDQVGNRITVNTQDLKVYKAFSSELAPIDHEAFVKEKLDGFDISTLYKLYGIEK